MRLTDVLDQARIRSDAPRALRRTYVVAVAIERDGMPLEDGEGRFALISLADERPGPRHVKWLQQIDVRRVREPAR
jgi:hypothetical protein